MHLRNDTLAFLGHRWQVLQEDVSPQELASCCRHEAGKCKNRWSKMTSGGSGRLCAAGVQETWGQATCRTSYSADCQQNYDSKDISAQPTVKARPSQCVCVVCPQQWAGGGPIDGARGHTRPAGRPWSGAGSGRRLRCGAGRCSAAGTPRHAAASALPGTAAAPAGPAHHHMLCPIEQ